MTQDTENASTPQSIQETLASLWQQNPEINATFLFGSQATGKTHGLSDIDLAVLADNADLEFRMNLLADAMQLLKTNDVDLVILNELPPAFARRVLTEGVLLFVRNQEALNRFKERNLSQYLDMQPFLERVYGPR